MLKIKKNVIISLMLIIMLVSTTCPIHAMENRNIANFHNNNEISITLSQEGDIPIISLFEGKIALNDSVSPNSIAVYKGYWKVHSWKGSNLVFGLGIECTHSILLRYQADIEIWRNNALNQELLSTGKMDITSFGGVRTLVDDKTMYTGSEKSIRILVKNIKVSTTAGPISRPSIGTFVNRP